MLENKRHETGGLTIIYFCLGDKWQDWQERGFANRTASIAIELARHSRVRRLIVVNNPTSYVAVFVDKVRSVYKRFKSRADLENVYLHKDDDGNGGNRQPRKITRHRVHAYFKEQVDLDNFKNHVTVIEQIRLFPKERSNAAMFALNNILYDSDIVRLLRGYLAEKGDSPLVLWINSPVFAKFAGSFNEDLLIYDARDDWIYHPQLKPIERALRDGYKCVRLNADIVFAVSKSLVETFSGGRPDVFLVPNGIDSRLFDGIKPLTKSHLWRPIVGYVGKMQDRFDVDLMIDLVVHMPEIDFMLVGPVFTPELFEPLKKLPNVYFTGRVHQMQIPELISLFDVCIMPHVKDKLTAAMNPLKLYEYLALGKPTVCAGASDLRQFDGLVEVADNAEEFREKIQAALEEPSENKSARMEFAKKQQWSKRVKSMVQEIDRKLFEKASTN